MKKITILYLLFTGLFYSCGEKEQTPISQSLGQPGIPTEITAEPISGGVVISYRIPDTEDILGVKAVYQLANGMEREAVSSFYENQIRVEGYNDMEEKKITLYAFNRAMELSEPVEVNFVPLESPISKTIKTFAIEKDFGGAQYTWENEDRANLTIEAITTDSTGVMTAMRILTTSSVEGVYNLRGYNTDPRWFAALVRDNFGNVSDTIFPVNETGLRTQLTPMYEVMLDKKMMRVLALENDADFNNFGGTNEYILDDDYDTFGHTNNGALPAALTIDLGQKVKLSRVVIHQRNNVWYGWGNPKIFEVYTTPEEPDKSGDWTPWNLIMECEIMKPSGLDVGTDTDQDIEAAEEGHDFTFSLDLDPLQYVRFNFTRIWTSSTFCHVAEITFYGDPGIEE